MYHSRMDTAWTERAKALMQSRGISQEDLATALACSRGAVGHYLTGRRAPALDQFNRIAAALDTDPAWLLFGGEGTGTGTGTGEQGATYNTAPITIPLTADIRGGRRRQDGTQVTLPAQCHGILISVNDYEPRIHAGEVVLVDLSAAPVPGDEVLVYYRNRSMQIHSLMRVEDQAITLDNITGEKQVRTLGKKDYKSIHKIAAIITVRSEG